MNTLAQGLLRYQVTLVKLAEEGGLPVKSYLEQLAKRSVLSEVQMASLQVLMSNEGLPTMPSVGDGVKLERCY